MMAADDSHWLLASDAGYGFVVEHRELLSRNKAGKAVLSTPGESRPVMPVTVGDR